MADDLELESERLTPEADLIEFDRHADAMIYTLNDHIKFMPRTPENDDLGEIRSFKKVGFRDNIAYSDEAVSSLEDSDYKRGTLDSGTTEEFDICNLPDVPLELDFDAPVPPARKSMFRVIPIITCDRARDDRILIISFSMITYHRHNLSLLDTLSHVESHCVTKLNSYVRFLFPCYQYVFTRKLAIIMKL